MRPVDPEFAALPLRQLADAALSRARELGAEHADVRVHRTQTQTLRLRDGIVQSANDGATIGIAVRVVVAGTWGFAGHAELSPGVAARTAEQAVQVARALRSLNRDPVVLAAEPVYAEVSWVSDYEVDPFSVPTEDKIALLGEYSQRLLAADRVDHVAASCLQIKEQTFYADLAGSSITQQRVRLQPGIEATTVDKSAGAFETMASLAPPVGRGWEYLHDGTWDWSGELAQIPELLAEKVKAPSVVAGPTDL